MTSLSLYQVVVDGWCRTRVLAPTPIDALQPLDPHQPGDPLAATAQATTQPQLSVHARHAVGPA